MTDQADLPLDLPPPANHPTGEVLDTKRRYSLPLSQSVASAQVVGVWKEVDRKVWASLVASAWDDLRTKRLHTINLRDLARLFRTLNSAPNGSAWLMESARRLQASSFVWEDENEIGTTSLLSGLKITKVSNEVTFSFDNFLLEKLLNNQQFTRLRLHFMIGLRGKYSVSLYMFLQAFVNRRHPVCELSLDDLRRAISVPTDKLDRWVDLNRFAIEPAIKQINQNADDAGFSVVCTPITVGRKVEKVRFVVTKLGSDRALPDPAPGGLLISHRQDEKRNILTDEAALEIISRIGKGKRLDAQSILAEFRDVEKSKKIDNPGGFLTALVREKQGMQIEAATLAGKVGRRVSDD